MKLLLFRNTNIRIFLISNFRPVLNAVHFLLGDSPASEFYMAMFRNTVCIPSSEAPLKMEQRECYETSGYKIQTPR